MPDGFVIDNSVLSACYRQGWMGLLAFRAEASEVLVSEHVWDGEFLAEFDDVTEPVWLAVEEATRYPYFPDAPTALGAADLSCLGLASEHSYAVVTNDRQFYRRADERGIDVYWGTDFLLRTFLDCGISQEQFDEGKHGYVEDVYLPDTARRQVLRAEKRRLE